MVLPKKLREQLQMEEERRMHKCDVGVWDREEWALVGYREKNRH